MRRLLLAGLLFLSAMPAIGCSRKQVELPGPDRPLKADEAVPADVQAVARGANAFAFDLHRQLAGDGNVFFSPFSIATALSMTCAGAKGETAKEMATALHHPFEGQRLHRGFAGLLGKLSGADKPAGVQLSIANSLWGPYDFNENFLAVNRDCYAAHVRKIPLKGAEGVINEWVAERTAERIKDLLPAGVFTDESAVALVNAVYFKGEWKQPFMKGLTGEQEFRVKPGRPVRVQMMHRTARLNHGRTAGKGEDAAQILELPYKSGDLSMVIILPDADEGVGKVEKTVTAENLEGWLKQSHETNVNVSLPRFKIAGDTINLKEPLGKLGMKKVFLRGADFSGMIDKVQIWIQQGLHKSFVDVNEEGAEAAAATAFTDKDKAAEPRREEIVEFTADHPFLFLIRDNRTGCILFLGRLSNPAS